MEDRLKKRLIIFGSIGVSVQCLRWLMAREDVHIIGVVCSRAPMSAWRAAIGDEDMQQVAPTLGIPLLTLDDILRLEADIGLSVRFHELLRSEHIARFRYGVVNLHGAPLPEMRGAMCNIMAILENRQQFGTSLHWMDDGIDSGNIIDVRRFPIEPHHTAYDLFCRANELGLELIRQWLPSIVEGTAPSCPQAEVAKELGVSVKTYYKNQIQNYKEIKQGANPNELWNTVRAFHFPGHTPAYIKTPYGDVTLQVASGSDN
ncbi:formyltransferase family protein [Paenibacillus alvei]|uniref:Formyl transferase n=1 Tax=Paenibacillus alvei TaxID=44250 RepID=A0AAP6ZSY7_PAEAL|nr:formyltransferase family protein [Paenibacillus alvei]MBG9737717.1 formyl transferase [Paenibacillus alvei]MBG9747409.1 formyl transferase [Paenibacillus alvei]MCY9581076.1 formyl transferase [Paenibacillus alvei]MCY9585794.1 formyl transferase [Paenibacillus alvei]NOJ69311.1 formyl transferase [Paenibacillus alvei]